MIVKNRVFGQLPDGREARLIEFQSAKGLKIAMTNYGGIITSIQMPDCDGNIEEIAAGFPDLDSYLKEHPYFGALVGRYANRIASGCFKINNQTYHLSKNDNGNILHGGFKGFDSKLWEYKITHEDTKASLVLSYLSPDMEEGFPGNLKAQVTYTLSDNNQFEVLLSAQTDAATHVSFTQHTYFNLGGFKKEITDHKLYLNADSYLESNGFFIPTGKLIPCQNSFFDYTKLSPVKYPLDHCFVLNNLNSREQKSAVLIHEESGRKVTLYCTQPGIQVYTGNFLDGTLKGHNQSTYRQYGAICLEPQHFPDSPNKPEFPTTLILPGETYNHRILMVFGLDKE